MQTAIVIFTKVPKTGDIKTRLTIEKGGIFTPEEARALYEACLLDGIDACIAADSGDVYVCYNQAGDRAYLDSLLSGLSRPQAIKGVFPDQGGSFDACMQYAGDTILKNGQPDRIADGVLIVGGDLPGLQPATIKEAVRKLNTLAASERGRAAALPPVDGGAAIGAAMVEGACQEGGFSIVGYTCRTPFNFTGVFYNQDGVTALDMLTQKAGQNQIPLGIVEMVPDLDIPVDLAGHIPNLHALQLAAESDPTIYLPARTIKMLEELGIEATAAPPQR